jgi:hypothetical protein
MLNTDQQRGLKEIQTWWRGNRFYMILDGAGGVGKSYLVDEVLKTLPRINPILLCPTNEALKQLRDKVSGNYPFKTIHSALGIAPTVHENEIKYEFKQLPSFWEEINLIILDESSMVSDELLEILLSLGINILFVGHQSQLPPVKLDRSILDPCISPVFEKGYPTFTLTQPMRNTGDLWDFNCGLEDAIYTGNRVIPTTFDVKGKDLKQYLNSSKGKEDLLANLTKLVLWSNKGVDTNNDYIRNLIHGAKANEQKYIKGDLIILTTPMTSLDFPLERISEGVLKQAVKQDNIVLYSNTKGVVESCSIAKIKLNETLSFECYKIKVKTDEGVFDFYEPVSEDDRRRVSAYYEHRAWGIKDKIGKSKAFKLKHFVLSCFANVKHYFAATSHRLQGATIENVVVMNNDINKNMCLVEQQKCRYVATSRAKSNLMFFRGDLV